MRSASTYYKWIAILYGVAIFIYVILRAIWVPALHDELGTIIHYFFTDDLWSSNLYDANNHLLNSFFGNLIHRITGSENLFLLRTPNVLAFPIYVLALFQISRNFKHQFTGLLVYASLLSIPFIIEYFAMSRGYGLSMAFFALSVNYLLRYAREPTNKTLILLFGSLLLAIAANLTILIVGIIVLTYLWFNIISNKIKLLLPALLTIAFCTSLIPLVIFAIRLKQNGALYYGSLEGIWDVTGESLANHTFFTNESTLFIPALIVLIFILVFSIVLLKKQGFSQLINKPIFIIIFLFFGSIVSFILLSEFFGINYPEDRAGIFLIPLYILSLSFMIDTSKISDSIAILFFFFPIALLFKLNFNTSIVTPNQRATPEFIQSVLCIKKSDENLMVYNTIYWAWAMEQLNSNQPVIGTNHYAANEAYNDIIIINSNAIKQPNTYQDYDTVAIDPFSSFIALRKHHPFKKSLLDSTQIPNQSALGEYLDLAIYDSILLENSNTNYEIKLTGEFESNLKRHSCIIVCEALTSNGLEQYEYFPIYAFQRDARIPQKFEYSVVLNNKQQLNQIKVYVWNKDLQTVEITDGKCYIYKVN